jgi:Methyltransferase domain
MGGTEQIQRVVPRARRWVPIPLRRGASLAGDINRTVSSVLGATQMMRLHAVAGWLNVDEGMTLFYFAHDTALEGRIVEIGTFLGKATAWIASALKARQSDETLVTMDPHESVKSWDEYYDIQELQDQCRRIEKATGRRPEDMTTYELFLDNMAALDLTSYVEPVRGWSTEVIKDWDQPIRMLFVDGSHTYEHVLRDLRLWEPWLCEGGILCMHDTGCWEGVARAAAEHVMTGGRFKKLLFTGNLTAFRKHVPGMDRTAP